MRQQSEQIAALQVLVVVQVKGGGIGIEGEAAASGSNTGSNIDVAKPLTFNGKASKVLGFLIVYRLYIRIRIRETLVKEQIQ